MMLIFTPIETITNKRFGWRRRRFCEFFVKFLFVASMQHRARTLLGNRCDSRLPLSYWTWWSVETVLVALSFDGKCTVLERHVTPPWTWFGNMPLNSWFCLLQRSHRFLYGTLILCILLLVLVYSEEPSCNIKVCRLSVSWECHEYLKCEFCRRVLFSWETLRVHVSSNHQPSHCIAYIPFPCQILDSRMDYKFNIELYRCTGRIEWMSGNKFWS